MRKWLRDPVPQIPRIPQLPQIPLMGAQDPRPGHRARSPEIPEIPEITVPQGSAPTVSGEPTVVSGISGISGISGKGNKRDSDILREVAAPVPCNAVDATRRRHTQ